MKNAEMQEKARQARNLYYQEWRKKNPDKVKETNARYWAKKAAELEETSAKK